MKEQTLTKETVYKGRIFDVESHHVSLPNGNTSYRDIIVHHGAVAVIAIVDDRMLLVRQYRKAIEQETLEIPAGKLDKNSENRYDAALRELREETGYSGILTEVCTMNMSPGYMTESITIYRADNLIKQCEQELDEDEFVDVYLLTREETQQAIQNGIICDAKTLYAVQYWDLLGGK